MATEQPLTCEDVQPWLAAYALGEPADRAAECAHLAQCTNCQQRLRSYQQVTALLLRSAPPAEPSPALRARIVATVGNEVTTVVPQLKQPPKLRSSGWRQRSRAFWLTCALVLLAVGLFGWNIRLQRDLSARNNEIAFHRQSWQMMIALLNDPNVQWYTVAGDQAHGQLWSTPHNQIACFVVEHLPALPADQIYQIWLVRPDAQVSAGTFDAHNNQDWLLLHTNTSEYTNVLVTIEPVGGSSAPHGTPIMSGSLTSSTIPSASQRQFAFHQILLSSQINN